MAINLYNSAEGGANGIGATTASTAGNSGIALNSITTGTGTITFANTVSNSGFLSYNLIAGAGSACSIGWTISTSLIFSLRAYVYITAYPTAGTQLMVVNASSINMGVLSLGTTGGVVTQANSITMDTGATGVIPLNAWVRYELNVIAGTGNADGSITTGAFLGESLTPLYSYTNKATDNTGTTGAISCKIGKSSASGNWASMYIDDVLGQDTLYLGPRSSTPAGWLTA